ncbi:alpha 1,3-glucosidase [Kwoniella heveanensis BCC8398]|uniref:Glucosidase II subunit alpha n=1 Tax=Kwoniella heveanensis BCC8398 TaxID=1296120 RepID=A0A1B9GZD4_9TREE|nr:alpha 1,3-glucosidase [Kwoniella heveanensis BCC8398]
MRTITSRIPSSLAVLFGLAILISIPAVMGVKSEDFKKCDQTSFCRRLRSIATKQEAAPAGSFNSPYSLSEASPLGEGAWTWALKSALYPEIKFELRVDVLEQGDGIARIRIDEKDSTTPFKRYNESARWALLDANPALSSSATLESSSGKSIISYGPASSGLSLEITHSPLKVTQLRNGQPEVVFNERSLFHMEHFRIKDVEKTEEILSDSEQMVLKGDQMDRSWFEDSDSDMFEEKWKKWTDTKPKGPEGFSLDLTFPGVKHVFGLPEHASPLSLPDTIGPDAYYSEPYRLFNVDIFEYLADSPMSLYGAIPLLHAHSATHSVGVLNLVASETWIDVKHESGSVKTHWMSESGIVDVLLLPGPKPQQLFEQYAVLTGPTPLPPQWSTAYHQCRWNYNDEDDVLEVDRRFDEADIPLDVTWLDIEYAEEHRYFDWDPKVFPNPVKMLDAVASKGRKMVAIIDPHVKKIDSFRIYSDAKDLDVLIKKADGSNFEGWCWTGSSVWVDFFNEKSWSWWTKMFDFKTWKESTDALFIWNDMNEPSVFDGPEISMPRDNIHAGGWEHRDVHNINGMMFHNQTSRALIARETPARRPFVLSRSFYAGSHRFGAIWTGDNIGDWEHLAGETAMLLSNNIAGMVFCGADVGGFFGNPSHELLVRWYQAGAFMPFFRAHAHIDTKRREPYLFEEPIRGYLRDAIRLRYTLLPVWYNAFHDSSLTGVPIMRPQYAAFPEDEAGFAIDDQYYVGDSGLLFKPVVTEGAESTQVYISDAQPYYDYFTHHVHPAAAGQTLTLNTPLSTFPLLIQGGSILPIRSRVRRSSPLMWQDPVSLVIAVSKEGKATGQLYLDDGVGYTYAQGEFVWRKFDFDGKSLKSTNRSPSSSATSGVASTAVAAYDENNPWAQTISHVKIGDITILGLSKRPSSIKGPDGQLNWTWESGVAGSGRKGGAASKLVVKNPGVGVVSDWEILFD